MSVKLLYLFFFNIYIYINTHIRAEFVVYFSDTVYRQYIEYTRNGSGISDIFVPAKYQE